jgi:hypothetical protein
VNQIQRAQLMLKVSLFNRNKSIPTRFYSEIHKPQKRLSGVVVFAEGKGADEWITIEEDNSKNYFQYVSLQKQLTLFSLISWVVWPFDYFGTEYILSLFFITRRYLWQAN